MTIAALDDASLNFALRWIVSCITLNPCSCHELIEGMADSFDPAKYKDTYTDEVEKLIEAKAKGQKFAMPLFLKPPNQRQRFFEHYRGDQAQNVVPILFDELCVDITHRFDLRRGTVNVAAASKSIEPLPLEVFEPRRIGPFRWLRRSNAT